MPVGQGETHPGPQPVARDCPPLLIVADDLTGACDAAVAFTSSCHPIRVQITSELSDPSCLQAITTESRDLPAVEAQARVQRIAEQLSAGIELFKKIDSACRGNTIAEIAATLRHVRFDLAVLAPAYPALGRTVGNGTLNIRDAAGERTLRIADLLTSARCSFTAVPSGQSVDALAHSMRHCLTQPTPVVFCDTEHQHDLSQIVRAARSLGNRILWIGSGGLAHALAAEFPGLPPEPPTHPRPGHAIFFIGSPHPVSRAQVDHLTSAARVTEHRSDAPPADASDLLVPIVLGQTTPDDICCTIASHDPAQIGCLFMTGGDTAHFVCRALGIHALRLEREFAPGVPLAIAEGGPFDGVTVVLKSGGFGEPDLLCRLLETCRQEVRA